ncbi:hypothetical protein BC940DRAFT_332636 [Gongronella butleri]|nr:hypothetical protein BC940DRAFT_332636 [Gongronella butleri]
MLAFRMSIHQALLDSLGVVGAGSKVDVLHWDEEKHVGIIKVAQRDTPMIWGSLILHSFTLADQPCAFDLLDSSGHLLALVNNNCDAFSHGLWLANPVEQEKTRPTCGQCLRTSRECEYLSPTIHIREDDFDKLNSALGDLGSTVGELQQDLQELAQSMQSVIAVAKSARKPVAPSPTIPLATHRTLYLSQEECHLYLTDEGISIEFCTTNVCFQKLRDLLYSNLLLSATNPASVVTPSTAAATKALAQKVPVYITPSFIFRPLYSIHPTYQPDDAAVPSPRPAMPLITNPSTLEKVLDIFLTCYVGFQVPDKPLFKRRFFAGDMPLFLRNAVIAWGCKHAAVFHNMFPMADGDQVGDAYYQLARQQLTEYLFDQPEDFDCVFTLLLLYGYHVGKASATLSCRLLPGSYVILGLAIQIALALKMHMPHPELPPHKQEAYRRLWALIYFLDALVIGQSEKPSMIHDDVTVAPQSPLPGEDLETAARVQYARWRTVIRRYYRDTHHAIKGPEVELATVQRLAAEIDKLGMTLDKDVDHLSPGRRHGAEFSSQGYYKLRIESHLLKIQLLFPMLKDDHRGTMDVGTTCFEEAKRLVQLVSLDAASNSRWCLFSAESSWAAVTVLKHFCKPGSAAERAEAEQYLDKLRAILLASNLARHHPIAKLVEHIDQVDD